MTDEETYQKLYDAAASIFPEVRVESVMILGIGIDEDGENVTLNAATKMTATTSLGLLEFAKFREQRKLHQTWEDD